MSWRAHGPDAVITTLAVDSGRPHVVYAGTGGFGVYRSSDAGVTWQHADVGLTSRFVNAIAVDPRANDVLYAATRRGVFRSDNAGSVWHEASDGLPLGSNIRSLILDAHDPEILYAGTGGFGLYRSRDAGHRWQPMDIGVQAATITAMAMSGAAPATLYAAVLARGIYVSEDGAQTWVARHQRRAGWLLGVGCRWANMCLGPNGPTLALANASFQTIPLGPIPMLMKLDQSGPLYRQIYRALRDQILKGVRAPGTPIPPSRQMAAELSCSRNVVTLAYEQLLAEGYLRSRRGSGTFVANGLVRQRPAEPEVSRRERAKHLSDFSTRMLAETDRQNVAWQRRSPPPPYDFWYGRPPLPDFPHDTWCRLLGRAARQTTLRRLDYGSPQGAQELREAIASYLQRARGVVCTADQVIVVNGFQQALDLVGRILLNPGDRVVVEEPHYRPARVAFQAVGADIHAVPVDADGLNVAELPHDSTRLVYVTPSHQFPTGAVLSLGRRLDLLAWARRRDAYILEDDYNGEYRYSGRPLETLQGLDEHERVLYAGTFSKAMFPALRVGYLVVPAPLLQPLVMAKSLADAGGPTVVQLALAEFITGGYFERHVRRARARNAVRRKAMVDAVGAHLGEGVEIVGANAGQHLMLRLRKIPMRKVRELRHRAEEQGVGVYSAAPFYLDSPAGGALLLGYASLTEAEIREGMRRLGAVMAAMT